MVIGLEPRKKIPVLEKNQQAMSEQNQSSNSPQMPMHMERDDNILHMLLGYYNTFVRPYLWLYPTALILFLAGGVIYLKTAIPLYSSTARC